MIRSLYIRNLRSLVDVHLDLSAPTTLVVGANGAGKSSIANAILYTLAGWCEWTDQRGAGYADLIRHGAAQANIDLDTDFGAVMRSLTPSGTSLAVDNRTGKSAQAVLEAQLPDRELLAVMLRSDGFIGLTAKEQQDVLFRLAGGAADADWFASHLTEDECEALREDLATRLTGSALAESLYKAAYAKRTEANRAVKVAQARTRPSGTRPATKVKDDLDKARGALSDLQQRMGTLQANIAARTRYEQVSRERESLQKSIAAFGERPDAETDEQFSELEEQCERLVEQRRVMSAQAAAHRARADAIEDSITTFQDLAGECVLGGVKCPLDKKTAEGAVASAMEALNAARDNESAAKLELDRIGHALQDCKAQIAEAQQRRQVAETWARNKASLERQLAEIGDPGEAPLAEDGEELQAAMQAQQSAVAALEAEHRAALEYELTSKLDAEAFKRAALLDDLVKKLAPTGLPAQAMRETVGKVIDSVNEALGQYTNFTLNEDLDVVRDGQATHLRLLSESEQLMVGAAISVAVAKLTGFGFVVVDAADRLDTTHRGPLLMMLLRSGVQALVLATPLNGKRPHAEGLAVYDLVDGAVKRSDVVQGVAA